jgi:hypothetical protein
LRFPSDTDGYASQAATAAAANFVEHLQARCQANMAKT